MIEEAGTVAAVAEVAGRAAAEVGASSAAGGAKRAVRYSCTAPQGGAASPWAACGVERGFAATAAAVCSCRTSRGAGLPSPAEPNPRWGSSNRGIG